MDADLHLGAAQGLDVAAASRMNALRLRQKKKLVTVARTKGLGARMARTHMSIARESAYRDDALRRALEGSGGERVLTLDAAFAGLARHRARRQRAGRLRRGGRTARGRASCAVTISSGCRRRRRCGCVSSRRRTAAGSSCSTTSRCSSAAASAASTRERAVEPTPPPPVRRRRRPPTTRCRCPSRPDASRVASTIRSGSPCACVPTPRRSGAPGRRGPASSLADGTLAPLALTTLLDEAAFWLGALATGEAGMTTELRVTLHDSAPADGPITVTGLRSCRASPAGRPALLGHGASPPATPPDAWWPAPPSRSSPCAGRRGAWSPACSPSTAPTCCVASSPATSDNGSVTCFVSARRRAVSIWHHPRHDRAVGAR